MPRNEKPVEIVAAPVPDPEVEMTPVLAALVLRAKIANGAIMSDVDDNQAELQTDGSIKTYVKQKDKSHKLMYVMVPDSFVFKLRAE